MLMIRIYHDQKGCDKDPKFLFDSFMSLLIGITTVVVANYYREKIKMACEFIKEANK